MSLQHTKYLSVSLSLCVAQIQGFCGLILERNHTNVGIESGPHW